MNNLKKNLFNANDLKELTQYGVAMPLAPSKLGILKLFVQLKLKFFNLFKRANYWKKWTNSKGSRSSPSG
jgi:hypothetical protein